MDNIKSKAAIFSSNGIAGAARSKKPREPLVRFEEMAEEFGLTPGALASLVGKRGGPGPAIDNNRSKARRAYYRASELRKWWREVGSK